MNSTALLFMIVTMVIVISFNAYFFYKVLTIPPRNEPDSYTDNDDEER